MKKIFTSSWGQLEKGGSNVGDEAIFASQVRDLSTLEDVVIGVMSAVPEKTESTYGVKAFDVGRGRLRSMARGVKWADAVIVGGGELAQDRSSLLYTPFNLHPIRLARRYGKPAFAWSVGIGQDGELARWTPWQLRKWLGYCSGVTVRDEPSYNTLMELGLDPGRVKLASDSTFTLAGDFAQMHGTPDILGVALRNVANRQGKVLPLELRRKLGLYREPDVTPLRRKWARLLDRHIEDHGGQIRFFPFHTGSLSNSDDQECIAVMSMMEHSEYASVIMPSDIREFLGSISQCRVMLSIPLHGAILSVVTGTVPVAVPYASKGFRFMEEAGLRQLAVDSSEDGWESSLAQLLHTSWESSREILREMAPLRSSLAQRSTINLDLFRKTCL
jgi:polysaccharide pyruvyl transferase WcaK-like protein